MSNANGNLITITELGIEQIKRTIDCTQIVSTYTVNSMNDNTIYYIKMKDLKEYQVSADEYKRLNEEIDIWCKKVDILAEHIVYFQSEIEGKEIIYSNFQNEKQELIAKYSMYELADRLHDLSNKYQNMRKNNETVFATSVKDTSHESLEIVSATFGRIIKGKLTKHVVENDIIQMLGYDIRHLENLAMTEECCGNRLDSSLGYSINVSKFTNEIILTIGSVSIDLPAPHKGVRL